MVRFLSLFPLLFALLFASCSHKTQNSATSYWQDEYNQVSSNEVEQEEQTFTYRRADTRVSLQNWQFYAPVHFPRYSYWRPWNSMDFWDCRIWYWTPGWNLYNWNYWNYWNYRSWRYDSWAWNYGNYWAWGRYDYRSWNYYYGNRKNLQTPRRSRMNSPVVRTDRNRSISTYGRGGSYPRTERTVTRQNERPGLTVSRTYTPSSPRTYTPRTYTPTTPKTYAPTAPRTYTPRTYTPLTPKTYTPRQTVPTSPRTYTPRTYVPQQKTAPLSPQRTPKEFAPATQRQNTSVNHFKETK